MKTKTQEQLEKEIEEFEKNVEELRKEQTQCNFCGSLRNPENLGYYEECLIELKAKLSQHLTDIKQIEKYLDMRLKDFKERKPKLIDDISKYAMQMSIDLLKEIKEALKDL